MSDRVVSTGEGSAETRSGFKDKGGSLIPPPRKKVTKMIGDRFVHSVGSAISNLKDQKKIRP
ncbi:unnamed protein product, partial [Ilex paraguariensis]